MQVIIESFKSEYAKNRIIYILYVILPSLIPLLLITGPFLPDLVVSICALNIVILAISKRKFVYFYNYPFVIFIIFCFYNLINSFFAQSPYLSLSASLFYFRFGLFCIFIVYLLKNFTSFKFLFTIFFVFTFISLIIDSSIQYFYGYNLTGHFYNGFRLSSFFGEELRLGSFVYRTLPILLGLLFYFNQQTSKINYLIIFLLLSSLVLILLSGERTALFMFLIFIILFLILGSFRFIFKLIIFLSIIFISIFILTTDKSVKQRVFDTTINQVMNVNNLDYFYLSRSLDATYKTALKMFMDKPVFGHGAKMFRELCKMEKYYHQYGCYTSPHNMYLQMLAELGIIGFVFLVISFFYVL